MSNFLIQISVYVKNQSKMATLRSLVGSELMLVKQHIAGIRQIVPNHIRLSASERTSGSLSGGVCEYLLCRVRRDD